MAGDNVKLRGAVARHKAQLEALRERDPEFHAYLQQSDAELLGFGAGEEDEDEDEEDEDEEEESSEEEEDAHKRVTKKQEEKKKKAKQQQEEEEQGSEEGDEEEEEEEDKRKSMNVTSALVEDWCQRALDGASITAMKQLLKAYR